MDNERVLPDCVSRPCFTYLSRREPMSRRHQCLVFDITGLPYRAAVQPLFGQLANIFGRRWVTMSIVALFTLGRAIANRASSGAMLIAGRAVQGLGSGGIKKKTHTHPPQEALRTSTLLRPG